MIVNAYSNAGVGITGFFLLVYGGLALALAWVVRGLTFLLARRRRSSTLQRGLGWWIVVPLCLLIAVLLGARYEPPHNPLFRLRFGLSESALTRQAERFLATSPDESSGRRRIGLFVVTRIQARDGQVRFITTSCGVVDACGLVYSRTDEPKRWQEDTFSHLRGPWWHVYEGF
jgi:hypothetical protein